MRATKTFIERESEMLKEKYSESQKSWLNATSQLSLHSEKIQSFQKNIQQKEGDILLHKNLFDSFKSQVAELLSDDYVKVESTENDIKDKLSLLMVSSKDRGLVYLKYFKYLI
jgi:hypothetical protein